MNFLSVMGGGKALGLACAVATAAFAASATEWKYYAKGAEDSPYSTAACISDGNWVLQVKSKTATAIWLSGKCVVDGSGVLDMRGLTINGMTYVLNLAPSNDGSGYVFANPCKAMTEFYADNVQWFGPSAFEGCSALTKAFVSGTFTAVPTKCFSACPALTNVVVSSPNLENIRSQAFMLGSQRTLETLEVTSEKAVTVASDMMYGTNPMTMLTVNGPAWTTTSVDSLLSKNKTSDTTKQCTIYANKENWASLAATLTDAETAVKPKKCFGVYREGSRKAWLVANNEKRGFAIIVR